MLAYRQREASARALTCVGASVLVAPNLSDVVLYKCTHPPQNRRVCTTAKLDDECLYGERTIMCVPYDRGTGKIVTKS